MATYSKIDGAERVCFGRAAVMSASGTALIKERVEAMDLDAEVVATDAVLDTRYKDGGSTTWERPGKQ